VRVARTGAFALEIAVKAPQPDLILLDIGLEDMDGYTVLHCLKSSGATKDIPVIFVTARDSAEDEEQGFDQGAVDYITKPIRPPAVLARVHLHLSLKQAQHELAQQNIRLEETLALKTAELEQSQRQIMQAEKMAAIGLLAGGIAHDFNNILAAIIGYTEMALENIDRESPLHHKLKRVFEAGLRAKDLVAQILLFARKTEYEKKPLRISLIVKEVMQLLRASLPATIALQSRIAPQAVEGTILGEPTKIHQILMNICTNAAHAMKEEGGTLKVTLESGAIDPLLALSHQAEAGPCLKLSISDTGHGMTPEVQQKIFEPYFTTKKQGEGTGLGLAVVYGIVKSLKGCITVKSQPGVGTTFHVLLPLITGTGSPKISEKTPLPHWSGTVLLVDDEEPLVDMMRRMLEYLGYTVIAHQNSLEALDAFCREPGKFTLVVTDQTMPQMTGSQLAREISKRRPDIPILLCSGFSEPVLNGTSRESGVWGLLHKPFNIQELAEALKKCTTEPGQVMKS
ncbi:MAG: response regulator, partial [Desulfobulbus sp.]